MTWGNWIRSGVITFTLSAFALSALQCSADSGAGGGGGFSGNGGSGASAANGGTSGDSGTIQVKDAAVDYSTDAFFANDPLPPDCSDAGTKPITPGGTPECPDDKNLQGCACTVEGQTAACWPGKRKNRNRGLCKDGTTTCTRTGELNLVWGECEGYQGVAPPTFEPAPGAAGAASCKCFSGGYWDVKNTSPCFYTQGTTVVGGVSTILDPSGARCPTQAEVDFATGKAPVQPFSQNTLRVDCNGFFKLCFTIKALPASGGTKNSASDCAVTQVCTEAYYGMAGKGANGADGDQPMPDLPSWITKGPAETSCAAKFYANGGYGEFSVTGTSDECDQVDKIFQTFDYCPFKCNDTANKSLPECVNCSTGSGAPF